MAFFPSPVEGNCCDDPCVTQDAPCDPCCACTIPEDYDYIHIATYDTQYVGDSSTCEKKFYVCQSVTTIDVTSDRCGYESGGPEYFAELENWLIGDDENESAGCDNYGAGKYLDDSDEIKKLAYFGTNSEKVIDGGWVDNTGCDSCETTIALECNDETDEAGFTGLPLCSDPSLEKPCNEGPYPKKGAGTDSCCGSGVTICGSGVSGSGVQGSGCCNETNDCGHIPPCCPEGTQCSGIQGSGTQGSGTQGSGCCTDPPDCDCDNCYDGEPVTKTFCVETVTTICDENEVTPPTSNC